MVSLIPDLAHRRPIRPKTVSDDRLWSAVALHRTLQKLQRSPAIPALRRENLKDFTLVINRTPKIVLSWSQEIGQWAKVYSAL